MLVALLHLLTLFAHGSKVSKSCQALESYAVCFHSCFLCACRVGKIFKALGLSVAFVRDRENQDLTSSGGLFQSDITYATASTLCFAYIRDNIATAPDQLVSVFARAGLAWLQSGLMLPAAVARRTATQTSSVLCWSNPWLSMHTSGIVSTPSGARLAPVPPVQLSKIGMGLQKLVCLQMMVDAEGNARLNYVIADEVDELLIDNSSTPMVISSGQSPTPTSMLKKIFKVSKMFYVCAGNCILFT